MSPNTVSFGNGEWGTSNPTYMRSTGSRCVVYAFQLVAVSFSGSGCDTRFAACARWSASGSVIVAKRAARMESNDGMGCASMRVSGSDQRSISRSNTDSDPKKNATMSTKPSVSPNQVWSQVNDNLKLANIVPPASGNQVRNPPARESHQRPAPGQHAPHEHEARGDERPAERHQVNQEREHGDQARRLVKLHARGDERSAAERDETPAERVAPQRACADPREYEPGSFRVPQGRRSPGDRRRVFLPSHVQLPAGPGDQELLAGRRSD